MQAEPRETRVLWLQQLPGTAGADVGGGAPPQKSSRGQGLVPRTPHSWSPLCPQHGTGCTGVPPRKPTVWGDQQRSLEQGE